jgi:DNA recombination protein RmuC
MVLENVILLAILALVGIILAILILAILLQRGERLPNTTQLELAISKAWRESGTDKLLSSIEMNSEELKKSYSQFEQLLRAPVARGNFGEMTLEKTLSDQLPPNMYGIREKIANGNVPDAIIKSEGGIICIDSKFPLDNFRRYLEGNGEQKEISKKRFRVDVIRHFEKVALDYIGPSAGMADFAFAYIPSEAVYYYLISEEFDLLNKFAQRGVQVVSPLTLTGKLQLIKAGMTTKKLSGEVLQIKENLEELGRTFNRLNNDWHVFYDDHLHNLWKKAGDINRDYKELETEFEKIGD